MATATASTAESPGSTDEVDLIDLETGLSPQPRIIVADATAEEQEHLLDVCPPKLEQKLSLTRRNHHERQLRDCEDNNVTLVTLGHDQVVPLRKRIDVVSCDTIKRVRDITKNLEPVMRNSCVDSVDFGAASDRDDDASRQINDAFDFLAELDDNEVEEQRILDQRSYPLEPTCFIQERSSSFVFDNAAFESSPPAKVESKRPSSMSFEFDGLKVARNSFKRLRSLTCSAVGLNVEQKQPWKKNKLKSCPYRKSWSAGSRRSRCDLVGKRKRRNSERMEKGTKRDRLRKSASSIG